MEKRVLRKKTTRKLFSWFISHLRKDREDGIRSLVETEGYRAAIDFWGAGGSLKKNNR